MTDLRSIHKLILILILSVALIFFAPNSSYAKRNTDYAVAKINNHVITKYEVEDRFRYLTKFSKVTIKNQRDREIVINQIIDKMVDEELIRQEAKKYGIAASENEINAVIEAYALKRGLKLSTFKNKFKRYNISFKIYSRQIEADLLWSKIISQSLKSKIKISDLQIKEFIEQQNQETDITQYKISEIFIPEKDGAKIFIEKLYQDLKSGADFRNFVKQFSQSATSESYGEIGWVSKNDIESKIYNAISNLRLNAYTKPIFLNDGYYIFKLLDKKIITEIDSEKRNFARNRIFMHKLDVEGKSYLMNLHKNSFVEIYGI